MAAPIWRPPLTATFELGDVSVELIPIGPPHRDKLVEGFENLSDKSRFLRFLAPVSHLSDAELKYLTEMDMVSRFAWGVLVEGEPAAVGRYARTQDDPAAVEIALTVVDDYQGRGIGTMLVKTLAVVAAASGFERLEFEVSAGNRSMLAILDKLGADSQLPDGVVHAVIDARAVAAPPVDPQLLLDVVAAANRTPSAEDQSAGTRSSEAEFMQ